MVPNSKKQSTRISSIVAALVLCVPAFVRAHDLWVEKNPTNQSAIVWQPIDTTGFVSWRAYIQCAEKTGQGQNTDWKLANGWWYKNYQLGQKASWNVIGLENQTCTAHYWLFRSNGTWDYGPKVPVMTDRASPLLKVYSPTDEPNVVFLQNFTLSLSALDAGSGTARIRVIISVPAGQRIEGAGWYGYTTNQYYKDFLNVTDVYETPRASYYGTYGIFVEATDRSGNTTSTGWKYFQVVSNTTNLPPTPPPNPDEPTGTAPAAPHSLIATVHATYISLSWSDASTNETGFRLYRNSTLLGLTAENWTNYNDATVVAGTSYCYQAVSYNAYGESRSNSVCTTIPISTPAPAPVPTPTPTPSAPQAVATSLVYPVKTDRIYGWDITGNEPACYWYDYQPHGSLFNEPAKMHNGGDYNYSCGDLGLPVVAVTDCTVHSIDAVGTNSGGWGKFIALRCEAPSGLRYKTPGGSSVTSFKIFYAHLDEIRIVTSVGTITATQIKPGVTTVRQGDQIGTIGSTGNSSSPHLHIQVRVANLDSTEQGYVPLAQMASFGSEWVDPTEFIQLNRAVTADTHARIFVHPYENNSSGRTYITADAVWTRQGKVTVVDRRPLGYGNHFFHARTNTVGAATWHFTVPTAGRWSVYAYIPYNYATATKARYLIRHDDPSQASPAEAVINQKLPAGNRRVYLGTYLFTTERRSVTLNSLTTDSPSALIAFDTLELAYTGSSGIGGAHDQAFDSDADGLPDEWELRYGYNPFNDDSSADDDSDSLTALDEYYHGTDPREYDTDHDGASDAEELLVGTDPMVADRPVVVPFTERIALTYVGAAADPKLYCFGPGFEWQRILFDDERFAWIAPHDSGTVICNVELATGEWLADIRGISAGHRLAANGVTITTYEMNGRGGSNVVFIAKRIPDAVETDVSVPVPEDPSPPDAGTPAPTPTPPPSGGVHIGDVHVHVPDMNFGCSMSSTARPDTTFIILMGGVFAFIVTRFKRRAV